MNKYCERCDENDRLIVLEKKLTFFLESFLRSFNEAKDIDSNGVYGVFRDGEVIYIGLTITEGHKRILDLTSFWDNHTLHKKLLKEGLNIKKLVWCKKGETSINSKEELIKKGEFTLKEFDECNQKILSLIKTFKFRFIDMSSENSKEIKNFEHFAISILNPKYND